MASLQRAAGNRAVTRLLTEAGPCDSVQRQPEQRTLPPNTERWESEEPYRDQAAMFRTTKVEVTAWAERGPAPPRISYRREVHLQTIDGINFYLDIRGMVDLTPGTALPKDPAAALLMPGQRVRSQRSVHVEGGDVIELREYSPHEVGGLSFGSVANAVMPDYAQLPLTPKEQEVAILAYLKTLPRRPKAPAKTDDGWGAAGVVADVGTDFLPIIGELKDLYRAVTGTDPVTGEKLAWWEQALAFLGAIPLVGKLVKGVRKGIKWLARGLSWLRGRGAALAAWFADKLAQWRNSRRAKRLEKAQAEARRLVAAEAEAARFAEAARLARNATPTLEQVQRLVPDGQTWKGWTGTIWGATDEVGEAAAAIAATERIGTVTREGMLALGVNRDVAQALYNWYRTVPTKRGGSARPARIRLLEHIVGLF